jgi:predicted AlkP superfamily phosphohydrolase/phosphomutase
MGSEQVLVVGLDGVDFRYFDRFADSLPHISALRAEGVESRLTSTHPPWTGSAWPSMYTGVDPSHHGVYDFFDYRDGYPDEASIVSRNDVDAPAVWNYLSALGQTNIVLNVPVTHPAEDIEGVVVPGYVAPADEPGSPDGIREELSEALGEPYRIYAPSETGGGNPTVQEYADLIRHRAEAATYLLKTTDWDFAFVQVQKTDTVFHNFDDERLFRRVFAAADDLVGELTDHVDDETTVILVSDHGMGPTTGREVYLNELLADEGYIETTSDPTNLSLSDVKAGSDNNNTNTIPGLDRVARALERVGLGPQTAYSVADRLGIAQLILAILPDSVTQSLAEGVDWRGSQAYCRRTSEQGIRLNVKGRDSEGIVAAQGYDHLREDIIEFLSTLETDEGDPIFEWVARREEVYDGPYADHACDILFRTTDMTHEISTNFHGRRMRPIDSHNHKRQGVFVASGAAVAESPTDMSLVDVAPAVFGALGHPIPGRLTGRIPDGLLSESVDRQTYDDVSHGGDTAYSQDRTEVADRLEDLGYL